jgi:hypothetical protein
MLDQVNATPTPHKRLPWNKGKLTGAKPPLRPKHVWSIWTTLQIEGRARDLTMFNLVIDSKLRGSNLAHERPLCAKCRHSRSSIFGRSETCRPVGTMSNPGGRSEVSGPLLTRLTRSGSRRPYLQDKSYARAQFDAYDKGYISLTARKSAGLR